nr:MAG TPA: hypothetical protein [Caudoviricetes sp.]
MVRYDSECCTEERRKCGEDVQNNGKPDIQHIFRCFSTCFSFERGFRKVLNFRRFTFLKYLHCKFIKNGASGINQIRTINPSCDTKILVLLRHACGGRNHLLTGVVV